jgi:fibronectin-binding autotransporter adhesin
MVYAGTLQLGNSATFPSGTAATVNGTLDLNTFRATVSVLAGSGTVNHSGTGSNSLSVDTGDFCGTIENTGGTLALLKTGNGQLILSGTNSYTGGTTLNSGTLAVTNAKNLGSGTITIGPATLEVMGNVASSQSIDLTDPGATIQVDPSFTYSNSGTLSGPGGLSLTGDGTLVLSGTNSYAGSTFVESGTLVLTNNEALAEGSSLTIGDASAFTSDGGATSAVAASSGLNEPLAAFPAITPVPEPGTLVLVVAGVVAGLATWRRRRNRAT